MCRNESNQPQQTVMKKHNVLAAATERNVSGIWWERYLQGEHLTKRSNHRLFPSRASQGGAMRFAIKILMMPSARHGK